MSQELRYRLVFEDPGDSTPERVRQIFASNYQDEPTNLWIQNMLARGGPESYISVYQTSETLIAFKRKPKPEAAK